MTDDAMDMTESEQLVQRFIDQDLSAEERMRLLGEIGRSEALRQRVVALERLALDVHQLPRPLVPAGFVANVLAEAVADTGSGLGMTDRGQVLNEPAPRRGVAYWLFAPRNLHWNLATALGAGAIALLVLVGALVTGTSWRSGHTSVGTAATVSPPAPSAPTSLVRLVVVQPGAKSVQVAGDFNGWNPASTPLEPLPGGAWVVTLPLQPGRYEYMFVVDGRQWIADPYAAEQHDDGFGSRNAVLDVRSKVSPL